MVPEKRIDYSTLVDMGDPEKVFDEVISVVRRVIPGFKADSIRGIFDDTISLYSGRFPGYGACNIGYHDLRHTTDVFLCMARLIHGAYIRGAQFKEREVALGLSASLLHDTGYIQTREDMTGTGAKYTKEHVKRSIEFTEVYFEKKSYGREELDYVRQLILATSLDVKLSEIVYLDSSHKLMGGMMFAADIIGQMADRVYLEKLLYLYREFNEARMIGYDTEIELLSKTIDFYSFIKKRLEGEGTDFTGYLRDHFRERWGIDRDLYNKATENNLEYLSQILKGSSDKYRHHLNRDGIVRKIEEKEHRGGR